MKSRHTAPKLRLPKRHIITGVFFNKNAAKTHCSATNYQHFVCANGSNHGNGGVTISNNSRASIGASIGVSIDVSIGVSIGVSIRVSIAFVKMTKWLMQ